MAQPKKGAVKKTAAAKTAGGKEAVKAKKAAPAKSAGSSKKAATKKSAASTASRKSKPVKEGGNQANPVLPHIDGKVLTKIIAKLKEMREESLEIVNAHMQADLKMQDESSDVGDDMDQASNERAREFSLIIHQRHLRRLKQIDEAFDRIEDGSYGLCEGTEEPINTKRLLIMPLARFSIEYQQQQEKMLGRSPDTGIEQYDESYISDE